MYKTVVLVGPKRGQEKRDFREYYLKEHTKALLMSDKITHYVANIIEQPDQNLLDAGWGWGGDLDTGYLAFDEIWSQEEIGLDVYPKDTNIVGAYQANELVLRPCEGAWPLGEKSHWLKRMTLLKCLDEMREVDFFLHWENIHGPKALKHHIGAGKYIQNHLYKTLKAASVPWNGLVCLNYWNINAFKYGHFSRPESRQEIIDDCAYFIDILDANLVSEYIMR